MPASCNPAPRRQLVKQTSFECLAEVIRALHAQQIPYMLTEAFASNAYGYPRGTQDADIVIEYSEGVLRRLRETLGQDFQIDPQPGFELKTGTIRNLLIHLPTKFEVELFRLGTDPHDQQRFARRRRLYLPELQAEVVIPTAEDVVLQKLRWQRDKDLADVRVVMAIQAHALDWSYINRWAAEHGTVELLHQARTDVGV
ncbi:MAG: hypothetical protein RL215_59 [Planctomycetota bacterium]